jgi:hypothetical protein
MTIVKIDDGNNKRIFVLNRTISDYQKKAKGRVSWQTVQKWKQVIVMYAKYAVWNLKSLKHVDALLEKRFHAQSHFSAAVRTW